MPFKGIDEMTMNPWLKVCHNAPLVSHLFFVDDSLIFYKDTIEEVTHIKQVLALYEKT